MSLLSPVRRSLTSVHFYTIAIAALCFAGVWFSRPQIVGPMAVVGTDMIQTFSGRDGLPRNMGTLPGDVLPDTDEQETQHLGFQYQIDIGDLREPQRGLGVLVPFTPENSTLFANNIRSAKGREQTYAGPGFGSDFIYAEIPGSYLRTNDNTLDIVTLTGVASAGPGLLLFGDRGTMKSAAEGFATWTAQTRILVLIAALVGLFTSLLGLFGTSRKHAYSCGLVAACGTLWWPLAAIMPGWHVVTLVTALAVGSAAMWALWKCRVPRQKIDAMFTGALIPGALASLLAIGLVLSAPVTANSFVILHFANWGLLPFLGCGLPLLLIADFSALFQETRMAQQHLQQKEAIIEQQKENLTEEIKARARLEERQRFVRDMHDGIGGQLLHLLMRVRLRDADLAEIETELQSGINDLRLMADSVDHVGDDFAGAMATFHSRARKQLDAAGIDLTWIQPDELSGRLPPGSVPAPVILNIYRLLQEAVTNTMRHSGSSRVSIRIDASPDDGALAIIVTDDGNGFDFAGASSGNGLRNMRKRADQLGGQLTFTSNDRGSGCAVRLNLPGFFDAI